MVELLELLLTLPQLEPEDPHLSLVIPDVTRSIKMEIIQENLNIIQGKCFLTERWLQEPDRCQAIKVEQCQEIVGMGMRDLLYSQS